MKNNYGTQRNSRARGIRKCSITLIRSNVCLHDVLNDLGSHQHQVWGKAHFLSRKQVSDSAFDRNLTPAYVGRAQCF